MDRNLVRPSFSAVRIFCPPNMLPDNGALYFAGGVCGWKQCSMASTCVGRVAGSVVKGAGPLVAVMVAMPGHVNPVLKKQGFEGVL